MGPDGHTRTKWGCFYEALPAPGGGRGYASSREVVCLGWKDKEDGVGCWQTNLASRHLVGFVNKGRS